MSKIRAVSQANEVTVHDINENNSTTTPIISIENKQLNAPSIDLLSERQRESGMQREEPSQLRETSLKLDCDCSGMSPKSETKRVVNKKVVPEVTGELLRNCHIVREKSIGSRNLLSRTGKVCGARNGANFVNEPLLRSHYAKSQTTLKFGRNMFSRKSLNGHEAYRPSQELLHSMSSNLNQYRRSYNIDP